LGCVTIDGHPSVSSNLVVGGRTSSAGAGHPTAMTHIAIQEQVRSREPVTLS